MKNMILVLLMLPLISFANESVVTANLTPIVKFDTSQDTIQIKDKQGNKYTIKTDCKYDVEEITEFRIRSRQVREGTPIKFSRKKTCQVESIARS